jgi:hypothetical protein
MKVTNNMGAAIIWENMHIFDAGSVRFGVERRDLSPAILEATFADKPEILERAKAGLVGRDDLEGFPSLHVLSPDGREWLRFDLGVSNPHYHYMNEDEQWMLYYHFDEVAMGDFVDFTFARLRHRLAEMLAVAQAPASCGIVDRDELEQALGQAEAEVREARSKLGSAA